MPSAQAAHHLLMLGRAHATVSRDRGSLLPPVQNLLILSSERNQELRDVDVPYREIEVDDEVYAALQREAVAFEETTPNDVLRRLLLTGSSRPPGKPGDLMPLLEAGRLQAGDKLVHEQRRKGRSFTAEVTSDGYVQLPDGQRFPAPSPALKACVGSEINGWASWLVARTGQPLRELRHGLWADHAGEGPKGGAGSGERIRSGQRRYPCRHRVGGLGRAGDHRNLLGQL